MATLRYDVDVDTRRAEARIGAFALSMRQRITQAVRSLPEIELDANSTPAQRELQRIRTELVALGRQKIGVDIEATEAQRRLAELNAALVALRAEGADIQIDADAAAAIAALKLVEEEANRVDGKRVSVKVDVDKSVADSIIKVAQLGRALGTIALPVAAANIIPTVAAIASSIGDLTGVAGLLPAVLAAGGLAIGTLKVGTEGFGKALTALNKGDLPKFNELVSEMAPEAQGAARAIAGLKPAWDSLRLDVQQRLFAGLGGEITSLGKTFLPILRKGMVDVAGSFNSAGRDVAGFLKSSQGIADVRTLVDNSAKSIKALSPALVNVVAGLTDVGVVGSTFLPELAAGATKLTGRFREFIAEARQSGQLAEWIQNGIDKVAQLGRVVGNTGGAVVAFFSAANRSGSDFLDTAEKLSAELERLLKSDPAQAGITAFFRETGAAIDAALPGVRGFATAFFEAVSAAANTGGLRAAGQAITDISNAVSPLLPALGKLAGETLRGLATTASAVAVPLHAIVTAVLAVVDAVGPVAPAVIGMAIAFRALGPLNGLVTGLGTSLAGLAGRMGVSEAGAGRIASAFSKVGAAIPLVGAAVVGLGILFDQVGPKADEAAQKVINGSRTMGQAIQEEADRNRARIITWDDAAATQEAYVKASEKVTEEFRRKYDALSPLQKLEADVAIAERALNEAIAQFGADSSQAAIAGDALSQARLRMKANSDAATQAEKSLGDQIVATSQASSAAANADVAYQQAVLNVARANENASKLARDRTASENDLTTANLAVKQANLAAADAARRKAEADATAAGASNVAEIGAQAYKEELIRLAGQASGPTRQALLDVANGTDTAAQAASTAEIRARLQKDELGRLAAQTDGPLRAAMLSAKQNFDTLGGAHATAEQRARAQKDELLRLANMASGPLRTEFLRMADQIRTLPDGSFTVTAQGSLGQWLQANPQLFAQLADGGVMPGYSPGRDNLTFLGPAGRLDLSGGEAVMRPEFTKAVSPAYIDAANKAARSGGVRGVQDFMARTAPRPGEGALGDGSAFSRGGIMHHSYAMGGVVRAGVQPYPRLAAEAYFRTRDAQAKRLAAEVKRIMDMAKRAMAAGGGPTTVGAARALAWARTQVGKPYIWGGVGPRGFDCSGWISALVNTMRGRNPYSRVGATGNFPWPGFVPGLGAGLNVGAFRGNPGHMAGSIGGVAVEASGGVGVRVGGGARGAGDRMFNIRAHLADNGALIRHGQAGLNLSGRDERMLSPAETRAYDARPSAATTVHNTFNFDATFTSTMPTGSVEARKAIGWIRDELDSLKRSRS